MKKGMLWRLLALLIIVGLMGPGCNKGGSTSGNPPASAQSQGAPADNQWPMKMPPEVPKFSYGTITECKVSAYQIALKVEKASPDFFNKYQSDLKNAGWTIAAASQSNGTIIIQATKGQNTIDLNFSNGENGLNGSIVYKHTYPEWS